MCGLFYSNMIFDGMGGMKVEGVFVTCPKKWALHVYIMSSRMQYLVVCEDDIYWSTYIAGTMLDENFCPV